LLDKIKNKILTLTKDYMVDGSPALKSPNSVLIIDGEPNEKEIREGTCALNAVINTCFQALAEVRLTII
jgi:hypothetical protein